LFSSLHCVEGRNIVLDSIENSVACDIFFTPQNEFQLVLLLLDSLFLWWQIFDLFNDTVKDSVSSCGTDYVWWIRGWGFRMVLAYSGYVVCTVWTTLSEPLSRIHMPVFDLFVLSCSHIYMIAQKCSRFARFISHIFPSWSLLFCKWCSLFIIWLI
jgi:hypothetical protein